MPDTLENRLRKSRKEANRLRNLTRSKNSNEINRNARNRRAAHIDVPSLHVNPQLLKARGHKRPASERLSPGPHRTSTKKNRAPPMSNVLKRLKEQMADALAKHSAKK